MPVAAIVRSSSKGSASDLDREQLPFELVTIEGTEPLREPEDQSTGTAPAAKGFIGWLRDPILLQRLHRRDNELTLASLPDADLYYLTFFWQFPAVRRACKRNGARYVYDANDAYWLWPGYEWYPRLFRAWLWLVERRCVRKASGFVTVSEGVAGLLEKRYGRRPEVIRNVHDLRVDEASDLDVRQASGVGSQDFLVVVVGNEKPSDAVAEALLSLPELPDRVHLALLGAGYEKHTGLIRELGLEGRVHLFAPVPPTEVTSAISGADAALINTRARGVHVHALPTRLFSAIAAGLPILYPPLPEVTALAEAHGLGVPVDTEDPQSVARGILELAEHPDLSEVRANVTEARGALNWEREENVLNELLDRALAA